MSMCACHFTSNLLHIAKKNNDIPARMKYLMRSTNSSIFFCGSNSASSKILDNTYSKVFFYESVITIFNASKGVHVQILSKRHAIWNIQCVQTEVTSYSTCWLDICLLFERLLIQEVKIHPRFTIWWKYRKG